MKGSVAVLFLLASAVNSMKMGEWLRAGKKAKNRVAFWHVTDFHYNPNYDSENGDPKYYCQVNPSNPEPETRPGAYGHIDCGAPTLLVNSSISFMKDTEATPDFILWTGDTGPHIPDSMATVESVKQTISLITEKIHAAFEDIPLYSTLGNHDSNKKDQFSTDTNPFYEEAARLWAQHIKDAQQIANLKTHGYYRVELEKPRKTTMLALNTLLWYAANKKVNGSMEDPGNQFAFIKETFELARKSKSKVFVQSHVPPGSFMDRKYSIIPEFNEKLLALLRQYHDVINGLYFGHTHRDLFMFLQKNESFQANSKKQQYLKVAYTAPAIVPYHRKGANPAIRYCELDEHSGDLRLIRQYYLDYEEANQAAASNKIAQWKLQYEFKIPEKGGSLAYFTKLFHSIRENDTAFAEHMDRVNTKQNPAQDLTDEVKAANICGIDYLDYDTYDKCVENRKPKPPAPATKNSKHEAKNNGYSNPAEFKPNSGIKLGG